MNMCMIYMHIYCRHNFGETGKGQVGGGERGVNIARVHSTHV